MRSLSSLLAATLMVWLGLSAATVAAQTPVISELMARNATTLTDQDGDYSDWVEIRNPGPSGINLGGYYLTDDDQNLTKWRFPSTSLSSGSHLVVFASGKNRASSNRQLHTNFKLAGKGESVALVRPDGVTIASSFHPYPSQRTDISFGLSGSSPAYFVTPTPGKANGTGVPGFVSDTTIQGKRGFHTVAVDVPITCGTANATIRFTLDGSPPTATTGFVYSQPLKISRTTVIRAAAYASGLAPSNIDTKTFLFVDDIVRQPAAPPGFPSSWGGAPAADYEMDPEITNSATYRQAVRTGLSAIPFMSLSLPVADMFGSRGIYSNTRSSGRAWERMCSVEYYDPSTKESFHEHAGVRIQGGASRNPSSSPKHSMSLRFRDGYTGTLEFDLFRGSQVKRFETLQLRAMYNNSWIHWSSTQRRSGLLIRDQWIRDCMIAMGQHDAGTGNYVCLFINGLFWGVHNLHERAVASHYAEWNGGNEDDYDARNGGTFVDGNSAAWNTMRSAVTSRNWTLVQKYLAVDNYIDWLIVNRFGGNRDLKSGGNWRAAGGGKNLAPWRFYSWDAERILENPSQNGSAPTNDPPGLLSYLDDIPDFVVRFGDRVHRHFFNGGAMMANRTAARLDARVRELDVAIVAESARWGDYRRDVHVRGPASLYTRNGHWLPEIGRLRTSYFPTRSATVLSQFRSMGLYPSTVAPVFSRHGGTVSSGFQLSMSAPRGTIYYTTNGVDPRAPGGAISTSAKSYSNPAKLLVSSTVKARVRDGSRWSALTEARFLIESISINEFLARNANGIRDNMGEREDWIELHNKNTASVVIGGMYLTDSEAEPTRWQIPANTVLAPGAKLLIWADDEPSEGPMHATFKLSGSGEEILLFDTDGRTLLDRVAFGQQQPDISTGRFDDGGTTLVTFLSPPTATTSPTTST